MCDASAPAGFESIDAALARHARNRPDHPAIVFEGNVTTWGLLDLNIEGAARHLGRLGVQPRDRVALLAESTPSLVEVFLGAVRAGAVAVPVPNGLEPAALRRMVTDARPRALAVSESRRADAEACALRVPLLSLDFEESGWTSHRGLSASRADGLGSSAARVGPEDAFDVIYSSGTTGMPKGIVHPHRMRSFQVRRMSRFGLGPDAVTLLSTPLCSNTTLVAMLPALAGGGTVVLLPNSDARSILGEVEAQFVTHAMLVPTQIRRILDDETFDARDLSTLEVVFSTGAHLPATLKRDLLRRWPGRLVEIYGQTEGGCTTVLDARDHPDKLDSVGKPAEGVDVRVVDAQDREVARGEAGEIVGRAESMMTGYLGRDDLTEALTWRDEAGRAFFRTGDLGRFDADGFLYLVGRLKDVIISGGWNVHPEDLERVLSRHEDVAEAAVVGVPSPVWGETPWAFVVPEPDTNLDADELRAWANARLGKWQRLSGLELRPSLPRNAGGKVRKDVLRGAMAKTSGSGASEP